MVKLFHIFVTSCDNTVITSYADSVARDQSVTDLKLHCLHMTWYHICARCVSLHISIARLRPLLGRSRVSIQLFQYRLQHIYVYTYTPLLYRPTHISCACALSYQVQWFLLIPHEPYSSAYRRFIWNYTFRGLIEISLSWRSLCSWLSSESTEENGCQ